MKDRPVQGNLYPSLVLEVKPTSVLAYNLKVSDISRLHGKI
ncbi:MAG: hypothetical protein R3E08_11610 [Thiotrichaceae bacterium]